jgi:hypothetical protein
MKSDHPGDRPRAVPDSDHPGDRETTDALLARVRRATEVIEPPADFPARVLAAVSRPRSPWGPPESGPRLGSPWGPPVPASWWLQLGPAGRRVVPFAAIAAAAAMALAWSADARLDDSADAAIDVAQGLP